MQALVVRQFGDPKFLKVEEIPTPKPGNGEALVQIKAAAINPSDVKNIEGAMHGTTLPRIPGRDFAGIVVDGPPGVTGREVWGTGGDIGFTRDGSHAQYIVLPLAVLTPKPSNLSMEAAGSAGLTFVTAYSALVTAANVSEKDVVLIVGAAGGVGSAAVQIAKSHGARVIGAVQSEADSQRTRENGADEIIITSSGNFAEGTRSITGGRGAGVVFDTTGFLFADAIESAAHSGRVSVISAPPDGQATFNLRSLYRKELRVYGIDSRPLDAVACAGLLAQMRPGFESGKFKVQAGQPRPLSAAAEAYELAGQGKGRFYFRPND